MYYSHYLCLSCNIMPFLYFISLNYFIPSYHKYFYVKNKTPFKQKNILNPFYKPHPTNQIPHTISISSKNIKSSNLVTGAHSSFQPSFETHLPLTTCTAQWCASLSTRRSLTRSICSIVVYVPLYIIEIEMFAQQELLPKYQNDFYDWYSRCYVMQCQYISILIVQYICNEVQWRSGLYISQGALN